MIRRSCFRRTTDGIIVFYSQLILRRLVSRAQELVQACLAGDSRKRVVVQRNGVEASAALHCLVHLPPDQVVLWLQFPVEGAASQQA